MKEGIAPNRTFPTSVPWVFILLPEELGMAAAYTQRPSGCETEPERVFFCV